MNGKAAIVTGANGLVGLAAVRALAEAGWRVFAFYRDRKDQITTLAQELGDQVVPWKFDLVTGDQAFPDEAQIDVIVHCAVADLTGRENPFLNVEMARTVALIANRLNIQSCIFISTQNVEFSKPGNYARSKILAETILQQELAGRLHIVRPALIYADDGNVFLQEMSNIARTTKIVPHLGGLPSPRLRPVHVQDVVAVIMCCLHQETPQQLTVYGAQAVSLWEIAVAMRGAIHGLLILPVPMPVLRLIAFLRPRISDKVSELYEDKVGTDANLAEVQALIGRDLRGFKDDLPAVASVMASSRN